MSDYTNEAQQRLLKTILALAGNEFDGVAPVELARALDTSAPNVTRDLANLEQAGFALRLPTGRWRLGNKVLQIATAHLNHMARIKDRFDELQQNCSRSPY